jgi:hypothetical protein
VDETSLPELANDQRASIYFPGAAEPIPGRVSRVSWEADRQTHEILVEVTPDRLERRVAIGQRADVRIELGRREGVLRLPSRFLHHDEQGALVYVDDGGRIRVARPQLGHGSAELVEVVSGLGEAQAVLAPPKTGVTLPPGRRWSAP